MVYVTFGAAVQRAERKWSPWTPAAFTLAAVVGAGLAGASLGALGNVMLREGARTTVAAVLGVVALAIGVLELTGHSPRIPQRDCETPREWLRRRRSLAAARNGFALGTGWSTRIGFWLWFVVPVGALLSRSPLIGLMLYAVYGFTRGMGPWLLQMLGKAHGRLSAQRHPDFALWVMGRYRAMSILSAVQLVILGVVDIGALAT